MEKLMTLSEKKKSKLLYGVYVNDEGEAYEVFGVDEANSDNCWTLTLDYWERITGERLDQDCTAGMFDSLVEELKAEGIEITRVIE